MQNKKQYYFDMPRNDLAKLVDPGPNKILDIGCGTGITGELLKKENKAKEVVGIELAPEIAKIAQTKLDKVLCGDAEELNLRFSRGYFDYIIAGDILEHLYDPWELLEKIRFYIKEGGFMVASMPNVRNWRVIRELILQGDWRYEHEGVLDETHLRFFTKKSIIEMFKNSGFSEIKIVPIFKFEKNRANFVNSLTFGLFEQFIANQYILKAKY